MAGRRLGEEEFEADHRCPTLKPTVLGDIRQFHHTPTLRARFVQALWSM
jgi:hypothetical protein